MKAKEYAEQFNANPGIDSICEIGAAFVREIAQLAEKRNVITMPGLLAIVDEQNRKWQAFCRQANSYVNENGFLMILQEAQPALHKLYLNRDKRR